MKNRLLVLAFTLVFELICISCNEQKIKTTQNIKIEGDIYGYWDEGPKNTLEDFYNDFSSDSFKLADGKIIRPPKKIKIDVINESRMKGKSVLQAINYVKKNFEIKNQGIHYYYRNDSLFLYGFIISFEIPHYIDLVDVIFYFNNEYTLANKYLYRDQIVSDFQEISKISSILANEYNYKIIQYTHISSKE